MNTREDKKVEDREDLVRFVKSTGSRVSVGHRDKAERIRETMSDLQVAF